MLKADYVELIENHFEAQGKKLSNLSKATLPKLKEIIEKYNIEYDEKQIVYIRDNDAKQKLMREKAEKEERDEKWEKEKAEERIELWNSLIDETKDNIVMFIVIKKHKNYLEFYWRNKKANKRLGEEVDKMEAKFKEEIGEDKVERKGLNHLCIKGVNLHHGFLYEDWNQEKEIKQVINDAKNGWKFNIDEILKRINEEELKEREKGCWFD